MSHSIERQNCESARALGCTTLQGTISAASELCAILQSYPMAGLCLILLLVALSSEVSARFRAFIAPHSHCDAGWTSTFEGYYQEKVRHILNTVTDELTAHPQYVFNWAEIGFLNRWWQDNDTKRQSLFAKLVQQRRIQFLGGGWVQSDEACTSVRDVVNQLTEGHQWLWNQFRTTPRIGWQIDPFGNVASTPIVFALCGFNGTVIDRVDIETTFHRMARGEMDFFWAPPSPYFQQPASLRQEVTVLTHQLGFGLYEGLPFVWEDSDFGKGFEPVTPANLDEWILAYDAAMQLHLDWYKQGTPDFFLFPWGGDFLFYNASKEFGNMDQLLSAVGKRTNAREASADSTTTRKSGKSKVSANSAPGYATVPDFFDELSSRASSLNLSTRSGEDLPYDWPLDTYWSGFYTSRAALKGAIRRVTALVAATDLFYVLGKSYDASTFQQIQNARRMCGILQHHDAVTGTAKAFVVDDYFAMIAEARNASLAALSRVLSALSGVSVSDKIGSRSAPTAFHVLALHPLSLPSSSIASSIPSPTSAPRFLRFSLPASWLGANVSVSGQGCALQLDGDEVVIGWTSAAPDFAPGYRTCQVLPTASNAKSHRREDAVSDTLTAAETTTTTLRQGEAFTLENDRIVLQFAPASHMLVAWTNKSSGVTYPCVHSYQSYPSVDGSAYVLRLGNPVEVSTSNVSSVLSRGPLVSSVTTVVNARLNHTWRLYQGQEFAEITYRVDSLEITSATPSEMTPKSPSRKRRSAIEHNPRRANELRKLKHRVPKVGEHDSNNLVTRFATALQNGNAFYTDDSGWLLRRRERTDPLLLEASVFPSIEYAFINDSKSQFSVISRQTHGCTSPSPGALELHLYRRMLLPGFPDLGLEQALNDTAPLIETQWLVFSSKQNAASSFDYSALRLALNNPVIPLYSQSSPSKPATGLPPLPMPLSLFTLQARDCCSGQAMLRLQNHGAHTAALKNLTRYLAPASAPPTGRKKAAQAMATSINFVHAKGLVANAVVEPFMIRSYLLSQ